MSKQHGAIHCLEAHLQARYPLCHTHTEHELFYCAGESGWQRVVGHEIPMKRGDVFIFPAGHAHIGAADPACPCHALVMNMSDDVFLPYVPGDADAEKILRYLCLRAEAGEYRIPLERRSSDLLRELFFDNISEGMQKSPGFSLQQKANLAHFFLIILRDPNHAPYLQKDIMPAGTEERIADVLAYINSNYMNHIGIEDVMDVAHMSRSHFHAVFREETGMPFLSYLNTVRSRQAEEILRNTDMPITAVADASGFPCLSHFYHIFKTFTGMTPAACRKAIGSK